MSEKNLVICDREIRYANSLGEQISKREDLAVKVYVCSSLEKVKNLSEGKEIHIFVVDESCSYQERSCIEAGQTFVLGRETVADLAPEEYQIRKYQSANDIIGEIFEVYIEHTKENLARNIRRKQGRVLAVYSPIHRVGKTSFAIALGKECAKRKKTLYLNMEEYAGIVEETQKGMNLGDLLYYVKQGNGNLGVRLHSAIRKNEELDYVLPIPVSLDLKEVTQKEWEILLEQIMENSAYELMILDMGESIQGLFQLLNQCDRIYMPVLPDVTSQRKIEQYDRNIEQLNLNRLEHITQRFVMPENIEEYARVRAKEEM